MTTRDTEKFTGSHVKLKLQRSIHLMYVLEAVLDRTKVPVGEGCSKRLLGHVLLALPEKLGPPESSGPIGEQGRCPSGPPAGITGQEQSRPAALRLASPPPGCPGAEGSQCAAASMDALPGLASPLQAHQQGASCHAVQLLQGQPALTDVPLLCQDACGRAAKALIRVHSPQSSHYLLAVRPFPLPGMPAPAFATLGEEDPFWLCSTRRVLAKSAQARQQAGDPGSIRLSAQASTPRYR